MPVLNDADALYLDGAVDSVFLGADLVWPPSPWGPDESVYPPAFAASGPADPNAFSLGNSIRVLADGRITAIRYHTHTPIGPRYVALWTDAGTKLASATNPTEVAGWNTVPIEPVVVTAGSVIVSSYAYNGVGSFSYSGNPFEDASVHLDLASGMYSTAPSDPTLFPPFPISPNHYFADVVFQEGSVALPAFTPADIAGLMIWLDATQVGGYADGDMVPNWGDSSGYGFNAGTVTTPKPLYRADGINGRPALHFGGQGPTEMSVNHGRTIGERTIFQVLKTVGPCFGSYHTTQLQELLPHMQTYGSGGGTIHTYADPDIDSGVVWSGQCQYITLWCEQSSRQQWIEVDGLQKNTVWNASASSSRFAVGGFTPGAYASNTHFGEFIVYERCLTFSEREDVLDYLRAKWSA